MHSTNGTARELSPTLNDLHPWLVSRLPSPVAGLIERLVNAIAKHEGLPLNAEIVAALSGKLSTGDDFATLAGLFKSSGLAAAAEVAFEAAAQMDFEDESLKEAWGGPFNGQQYRQRMFEQLLKCVTISAIVETGTFRGSTTEFMADRAGVPLFSCELSERFFHFARMRLAAHKNVRLFCKDSRAFLKEILASDALPGGPALFYLDAHWYGDLPLWDEINIIFGQRTDAVIMIDDFRVPGDTGFGYDDYGPGKSLNIWHLRANLASDTDLFFPHYPSVVETGAKRGVIVLAQRELADLIARDVPTLDRIEWRQAMLLDATVTQATVLDALVNQSRNLVPRLSAAEREVGLQRARVAELENEAELQRARVAELENEAKLQRARVRELQNSRWRKLGLRLGVAKRASFEH